MLKCYHKPCDTHVAGNEADVSFLAKTTEATAWTAADLAGAKCGPNLALTTAEFFARSEASSPSDDGLPTMNEHD